MLLHWEDDEVSAYWSQRWTLPIMLDIQEQYDGRDHLLAASTWSKHIRQQNFPTYCFDALRRGLLPTPKNIIQCFQQDYHLEALVLIVAWGSMTRTKEKIYIQPNEVIEHALRSCIVMTKHYGTVQHAWNILVNRLGWSAVISSKVLHFLARSLGDEDNPPVPIDNKVILEQVWPRFHSAIRGMRRTSDKPPPEPWNDTKTSWLAYNRYMTAMRYWSQAKGWTTTQFENTVFKEYYPTP
jgi:hypothetical protein